MSMATDGAEALISMFGEEVVVTSMDNEVPDDSDNPMFLDSSGEEGTAETHRVRLYTSPSNETLQEYGFDESTEAMMYDTEDIASEGDKVEYDPSNMEWVVDGVATNQIGQGPYIFVYSMVGVNHG